MNLVTATGISHPGLCTGQSAMRYSVLFCTLVLSLDIYITFRAGSLSSCVDPDCSRRAICITLFHAAPIQLVQLSVKI
jgi:hypothetical protein